MRSPPAARPTTLEDGARGPLLPRVARGTAECHSRRHSASWGHKSQSVRLFPAAKNFASRFIVRGHRSPLAAMAYHAAMHGPDHELARCPRFLRVPRRESLAGFGDSLRNFLITPRVWLSASASTHFLVGQHLLHCSSQSNILFMPRTYFLFYIIVDERISFLEMDMVHLLSESTVE